MRILLVSDIHANWPALEAIQERFDACLFLGDLVDYGLQPQPCIDWVRQHATYAVRGNHDHGVAQGVAMQGSSGFRYLTAVTRPLTCALLSEQERQFLAELPTTQYLTLDGRRFLLVHATPRDPMDEYPPIDVDFWKRRLEGIEVDYVCVGHTHIPFELSVGNCRVINPGSVGLQRDGDPRASYAIWENDKVELKRMEYPIEKTIEAIRRYSLPEDAQEMLVEVYRHGKLGTPRAPVAGGNS